MTGHRWRLNVRRGRGERRRSGRRVSVRRKRGLNVRCRGMKGGRLRGVKGLSGVPCLPYLPWLLGYLL